ncbi:MAG: transposase [Elusimicrobia bacterium]|nr:transposase [Elusimicrobiota bacterium]
MSIHHVMARGNGGQEIIARPEHWRRLRDLIAKIKSSSDFKLYAFCLMPNHLHMLIRVLNDPLSHFMQRIQTAWAMRFNRDTDRRGHVFQGRFKSKDCTDDTEYCRWLLRYIHLNPVKAGLVARPEEWAWSSYRQFIGRERGMSDIKWPLSLFAPRAVPKFEEFVLQGIGDPREPEEMQDGRIETDILLSGDEWTPAPPSGFEELAGVVAAEAGISLEMLYGPARARAISAARRELALRAVAFGFRAAFIAQRLKLSKAAVTYMLRGGGGAMMREEDSGIT